MRSIKEDFSIFLGSIDLVYLDCAATTPVPDEVLAAWLDYQKNICVSIGRGGNKLIAQAELVYNDSVEVIKNFFSCGSEYDLVFTKNATESLNLLAYVFGKFLKRGDILLLSEYEHNSSLLPWLRTAHNAGAQIVKLPVKPDGALDYGIINYLPKDRIKTAMLSLISNVTGYTLDLEEIRRRVNEDTFILLDISQAVGHIPLNLQKLNADAYALSAHKMYAPKNIGACMIRKEISARLEPFTLGGGMVYNLLGENADWQPGAMKYMAGTFDVALISAWAKACQYLTHIGRERIFRHEREIFSSLGEIFGGHEEIFLLPNGNVQSSIYSFCVENFHIHDLDRFFDERNIIVRTGHMCSQSTMAALNLNGAVRISWGIFTDENDVERFADAVKQLCKRSAFKTPQMSSAMLVADYVIESSGVACGDEVKLYLSEREGRLFFSFLCNSCAVASRAAKYLEVFSGCAAEEIYLQLKRLEQRKNLRHEELWIGDLSREYFKCFLTPLNLLKKYFQQNKFDCNFVETENLSCDACVSVKSVPKIISKNPSTSKRSIRNLLRKIKHSDNDEDFVLQKVGLCACADSNINEEKAFLESITDAQFARIKKLRLAAPCYNKAVALNCPLAPKVEELVLKQLVSMRLADVEIRHVENFIQASKLPIDSVKGQKNTKYYPENFIRAHMDYDYLAADCEGAFRLISYLLNERGFKFISDASVPFSFKAVLNEGSEEILTGHIHLEKILQDSFQVVVDINMGAFPLGRTGAIKFNDGDNLSAEDLFCITLAHLFKHEIAFVKDINDLYFLLSSKELDEEILRNKIQTLDLCVEYEVLTRFLRESMNLNVSGGMIDVPWRKVDFSRWPYSQYSHFKIKLYSLLLSCQRKFGKKLGLLEVKRQLTGTENPIPAERYKPLCNFLNQRTYLYPVVIFNQYIDISAESFPLKIADGIFISENLIISSIGIFTPYELKEDLPIKEIKGRALKILSVLGKSMEHLNFDCFASARKDLWLY